MAESDVRDALEQFGLDLEEIEIYLALVELGQATAQQVSKKTGVIRQTVYDRLNGLEDKGLVSGTVVAKVNRYSAADPDTLLRLEEERLAALKRTLPELKRMEGMRGGEKLETEIIMGTKAMGAFKLKLISDAKRGEEYLIFGRSEEITNERDLRRSERLSLLRAQKGLKQKVIQRKDSMARSAAYDPAVVKKTNVRLTDFIYPRGITVFRNKTIFESYQGEPMAVVITSSGFAKQFSNFFHELYDTAEPFTFNKRSRTTRI